MENLFEGGWQSECVRERKRGGRKGRKEEVESDIREKKSQRFRRLELLHRLYSSVQRTKREKKSQNGDELSRQSGKAGDILICDTMPFRTDGGGIYYYMVIMWRI